MSLELHEGDTVHSDRYDRDMTIVHVVDHTMDGLGCLVLECADSDGWAYDVIEGIAVRVGSGPERGRANHVLYTGNTLHTLADMTETQDSA